jgi:hypothetical protein
MKKLLFWYYLSVISNTFGQVDRFNFNIGGTFGAIPVTLEGPVDVSNGETVIDNYIVTLAPEYVNKKIYTGLISTGIQFGFHIPCYKSDNWSMGIKLNAGAGFSKGILEFEDYYLLEFGFPQFAYFRKQFENRDLSFLLGYKKCFNWISFGVPIAGIDFNSDSKNSFRIYTSLYRQRYYTQYTNGDLVPSIKIGEINFSIIHAFGK